MAKHERLVQRGMDAVLEEHIERLEKKQSLLGSAVLQSCSELAAAAVTRFKKRKKSAEPVVVVEGFGGYPSGSLQGLPIVVQVPACVLLLAACMCAAAVIPRFDNTCD